MQMPTTRDHRGLKFAKDALCREFGMAQS